MTWYPLDTTDASVFDDATMIYRYLLRVDVPPRRVWESLISDNSLADWGQSAKSVTWMTPRPFGIGTERQVVLPAGAVKVHERFFRWDDSPGVLGYSFFVYEASIPFFRRLAENYIVEPDGDGALLTWTVAIDPNPRFALPMKLLSPVNRFAFGRMAADGRKYFAKLAASGRSE